MSKEYEIRKVFHDRDEAMVSFECIFQVHFKVKGVSEEDLQNNLELQIDEIRKLLACEPAFISSEYRNF
jgi:hypothetical protein